jgi:hypothetical protein
MVEASCWKIEWIVGPCELLVDVSTPKRQPKTDDYRRSKFVCCHLCSCCCICFCFLGCGRSCGLFPRYVQWLPFFPSHAFGSSLCFALILEGTSYPLRLLRRGCSHLFGVFLRLRIRGYTADLGFTGVRTLRPRVETRGTEGYGRDRAHRPRARRARSCGATLAPTMHMRARAALRFRSHPHTGCRAPRPSARPSRRPRGRLRASCSARPPRAMLVHPHSSRIALLTASYRALAGTMSTCVYQLSERGALAVAAGRRVQTRSGIYIGRQPRLLPIPPMTAFNRRRCIARAVRGARR